MKTFSIAAISGLFISLALFWLMQQMISNNQQVLNKTENIQMTEFIRLIRKNRQENNDKKTADEPPPPKKRPPPPSLVTQQVQTSQIKTPTMNIPNLDIPFQTKGFSGAAINKAEMGVGAGAISTNVIPLVRIPPQYPMRAANRRIEGWVKIEFTITTEGTVKDPVVVEAHPSKVFNRAALRAIRRWKFKAKIVDNEAFEQRAAQILQFKLSK